MCQKQPPQGFYKKTFLKLAAIFTGKHLCWSLKPSTLLKRRLWHRYFSENFAKFKNTFFIEHLRVTGSIKKDMHQLL